MLRTSSWCSALRFPVILVLFLAASGVVRATDHYSQDLLQIPSLSIGSATYTNVVLAVGNIISRPVGPAPLGGTHDVYYPSTGELYVPEVVVGNATYFNVVAGVSGVVSLGAASGVDTFDGTQLHLAYVTAGNTTYADVVVTIGTIEYVSGGMPGGTQDYYDPASKGLSIPALSAGGRVYTNVNLTVAQVISAGRAVAVPVLQQPFGGFFAGNPGYTTTYNGSGFVPGSVVLWDGNPLATTYLSPTQLQAVIPAALIATPRSVMIAVSNAAEGGPVSAPVTLTIVPEPTPGITTLAPATITGGSPGFTLTVNGGNFTPDAQVVWNGSPRQTTFVSSNQLTAAITAADIATAGTAAVTVISAVSGYVPSSAAAFAITAAVTPALTRLVPATLSAGGGAFSLSVIGSGFVAGSTVDANGVPLPTTYVSPTQLSASVTPAQVATAGAQVITVVNAPNLGGASNPLVLQVTARTTDAVSYQIDTGHSGYVSFQSASLPTARLWSVDLGTQPSFPLIVGGTVYVTDTNGEVQALDGQTGARLWGPVASPGGSGNGLAYDAGTVFALSGSGFTASILMAINASTGEPLWSVRAGSYGSAFPPVAANGFVYVGGLSAFDEQTGAPAFLYYGQTSAAPAVTADGVYISPSCQALDLQPVLWKFRWQSNATCDGAGGNVPVVAGGLMFAPIGVGAASYTGNLYASETGQQLGTFATDVPPAVSPTSALLLRSSTLRNYSLATGQTTWSFSGDGKLTTPPLVVSNFVFVGSSGGNLYALDAGSGALLGTVNLGQAIAGPQTGQVPVYSSLPGMSAGDGLLIVPAGNTLHAFRLSANP